MIYYLIALVVILIWGFISWKFNLAEKSKSKESFDVSNLNYKSPEILYYYTDEECINHCYFIGNDGGYGGHQCLWELDECLEKEYRQILKEKGRQGLWDYGIRKGFFKENSPDYYGFFGKKK